MTYKQLKIYLDSLDDNELSKDVRIKLGDGLYPLISYACFAERDESELFDESQLFLKVTL